MQATIGILIGLLATAAGIAVRVRYDSFWGGLAVIFAVAFAASVAVDHVSYLLFLRRMGRIGACLLVVFAPCPALAGSCGYPTTYAAPYVAPTKVAVVAAVTPIIPVIAVPVLVPSYSAAFLPTVQVPVPVAATGFSASIAPVAPYSAPAPVTAVGNPEASAEIARLRAEIAALKAGQPVAAPAAKVAAPAPARNTLDGVVANKCVKCHGGGKVSGGIDLSADWSGPVSEKVLRVVATGRMGSEKTPDLDAAEKDVFFDALFASSKK